jgi:hypothetical protein
MGVGLMSKVPDSKRAFKVVGGPLTAMLFEVIALIYVWLANGIRCYMLIRCRNVLDVGAYINLVEVANY